MRSATSMSIGFPTCFWFTTASQLVQLTMSTKQPAYTNIDVHPARKSGFRTGGPSSPSGDPSASVHWPQKSWKTQPAQPNQLVYPVSYFFRSLELPRCSCGVDTWGNPSRTSAGISQMFSRFGTENLAQNPKFQWFILIYHHFPYENWHLIIWGVTPHHSLAALVEDGVMLRHHQVTIPGGAPIPVGHLGFVE